MRLVWLCDAGTFQYAIVVGSQYRVNFRVLIIYIQDSRWKAEIKITRTVLEVLCGTPALSVAGLKAVKLAFFDSFPQKTALCST